MSRRFATLDVFTTKPHAGNPLAVVLDSQGLDAQAMQAIACEFNLSETVFVAPPANPANRAALRIFTPARELPFAGHPTVGTAVLLALRDAAGGATGAPMVLEEQIGLVPCTSRVRDERAGFASFTLPRLPAEIAKPSSAVALAEALGLDEREIGFDAHVPSVFSAGVGLTLVPVFGMEALDRIRLDLGRWPRAMKPQDQPAAFVYCRQVEETGHHFHARMFAPSLGIAEDPATGSAVAALAGAIMRFDRPEDGEHRLVVEQGYEMGRPSQIELELTVAGGTLISARIGGAAVVVSEGTLL